MNLILPFGHKTRPALFSRLMAIALAGLIGNSVVIYLDDIIIFLKSVSDHHKKLREWLTKLRTAKLKIKFYAPCL